MTFEKFKELIEIDKTLWDYWDKLNKLGIEIMNSPLFESACKLSKEMWTAYYGEEGQEWVSWFLYEKMESKNPEEMKAWDEEGNEICANLEELYKYLEKNLVNSK